MHREVDAFHRGRCWKYREEWKAVCWTLTEEAINKKEIGLRSTKPIQCLSVRQER